MPEAVTNLDRRMLLSGLVVNCRLIILWLWSRGRSAAVPNRGSPSITHRVGMPSTAQESTRSGRSCGVQVHVGGISPRRRRPEPGQTLSKKAVLESPRLEARAVMVNAPGTSLRAITPRSLNSGFHPPISGSMRGVIVQPARIHTFAHVGQMTGGDVQDHAILADLPGVGGRLALLRKRPALAVRTAASAGPVPNRPSGCG
jgi:hypothetical protein